MSNVVTRAIKRNILLPAVQKLLSLAPIGSSASNGGWYRIFDNFAGRWQQDVISVNYGTVDAYWADFACKTLICGDISKLPIWVMEYSPTDKVWTKTSKRPVLQKPNRYQTTIEFIFSWMMSQLRTGNTYVLKQRDEKNFVVAMYVLDPALVEPLVTPGGDVYYRLSSDALRGVATEEQVVVPATEIIHDRMYTFYHPLCGLPPVFACGLIAMQGAAIVNTSAGFFTNRGLPAGILTAPGHIADDTANRLKTYFDDNFTGANAGKVAVLGDGLTFVPMGMKAAEQQLIEQLKMTGEMIAACYHVPGYKIGVGQMPSVSNTAALNQQYYDQCLQFLIEKMEARLDEGLELRENEQCWVDISALMRMDPVTFSDVLGKRRKDGILSPNEVRRELNYVPVVGGELPYMQQQDYSLADLARRSERDEKQSEDGGTNVQAQAMNGAQVSSLQSLIVAVANGEMPPEAAAAAISVAFPLLTDAEINAIINPLKGFEPKVQKPDVTPAPTGASPAEEAEEPEEAAEEAEEPEEAEEAEEPEELSIEIEDFSHSAARPLIDAAIKEFTISVGAPV